MKGEAKRRYLGISRLAAFCFELHFGFRVWGVPSWQQLARNGNMHTLHISMLSGRTVALATSAREAAASVKRRAAEALGVAVRQCLLLAGGSLLDDAMMARMQDRDTLHAVAQVHETQIRVAKFPALRKAVAKAHAVDEQKYRHARSWNPPLCAQTSWL